MADGLGYTEGAGKTVATDDCTAGHVQLVKLAYSADGVSTLLSADALGLQVVSGRRTVRKTATPTNATSGYVATDYIGADLVIANAARVSGGSGRVTGANLISKTVVANAYELWLFENDPTIASADNAPVDITDANLVTAQPFAVIDFLVANNKATASNQFTLGTVAAAPAFSLPFVSVATSLYGALIARTVAGQLAGASDLVLSLYIEQD